MSTAEQTKAWRMKFIKYRDCIECGKKLDDNRVTRCAACLLRNAVSAVISRQKCRESTLQKQKEFRVKIKNEVFTAYGGWQCACCGEKNRDFLSLDHINGGGNNHRKVQRLGHGHAFYLWLKSKGFPDGYQVLCMNCNFGKRYSGICPHKEVAKKGFEKAWIETHLGERFFLLNPTPESIHIEDIAHALAMQCRWTGHCKFHYSVAQHSYYCSFLGPEKEALDRLMHDASESFMGDMNRPLKHFTPAGPAYQMQEKVVQSAILKRFGLSDVEPPSVHIADNQMLYTEKAQIMGDVPWETKWVGEQASEDLGLADVKIEKWTPEEAKEKFLKRFFELYNK